MSKTNPVDRVKQADRYQKRAKSWLRKWPRDDELHLVDGQALIDKLVGLLGDVDANATQYLEEAQTRYRSYQGPQGRPYEATGKFLERLEGELESLREAVADPRDYVKRSQMTYGIGGEDSNVAQHLVDLTEAVFQTMRSLSSLLSTLRASINPASKGLKRNLLH